MADRLSPKSNQHLGYLDSARGIAAMVVMIGHFINWKFGDQLPTQLASIVFNASDAVSFFFVLSGFVLSYKYIVLNESLDMRRFYLTRVFRLWPGFFVTILILALNSIRTDLNLHSISDILLLNKTQFWEEAILIRNHNSYYIPGWTLVIELTLSFFVPFLILIAKKGKGLLLWLLLAFLLMKAGFQIHFALGVLISCLFNEINQDTFKLTKWYRYRVPILLIASLLFSIRQITRISPLGSTYTYIADYLGIDFFFYTGIASFVFIVAIVSSKSAHKFLEHKFLRFFGKISYGIYLIHWVLVADTFFYWDSIIALFPNAAIAFATTMLLYILATLSLATIIHYTVELPFISMCRRINARLRPSEQIN